MKTIIFDGDDGVELCWCSGHQRYEHPDDFHRSAKSKSGRQGYCKKFKKEYNKEYYQTPGYLRIDADRRRRDKKEEPLKVWAHNEYKKAVNRGDIEPLDYCCICGRDGDEYRIEGHHNSYLKPFDVDYFCNSCHKKVHSGKIKIVRL